MSKNIMTPSNVAFRMRRDRRVAENIPVLIRANSIHAGSYARRIIRAAKQAHRERIQNG